MCIKCVTIIATHRPFKPSIYTPKHYVGFRLIYHKVNKIKYNNSLKPTFKEIESNIKLQFLYQPHESVASNTSSEFMSKNR